MSELICARCKMPINYPAASGCLTVINHFKLSYCIRELRQYITKLEAEIKTLKGGLTTYQWSFEQTKRIGELEANVAELKFKDLLRAFERGEG